MRTTLLNQKVTKPQRLKALRQLGDNKQQLNFYGIDAIELQKAINIYPNPTDATQTIQITTDKVEVLKIELYDLSGRQIKNVFVGKSNIGKNQFEVNINKLAQGAYFYRIEIGSKLYFKKIVTQ